MSSYWLFPPCPCETRLIEACYCVRMGHEGAGNGQDQDQDHYPEGQSSMHGTRRMSFIVTLWAEPNEPAWSPAGHESPANEVWRGYLETSSRERRYFSTLAELNHLLIASAQWRDPSDTP